MVEVVTQLLSIGEVCDETGLSPDLVRVWERRYGFPTPVRLPSGHRRYRPEDLHRLRLLVEAVSLGHKPSQVVAATDAQLRTLLRREGKGIWKDLVDPLFKAVRRLDALALGRLLDEGQRREGLPAFLSHCVSPLLDKVGMAWAEGKLDIHHEHFLTEVLEDRLRKLRSGQKVTQEQAPILFATLPGERHRLGLLMAALSFAAQGFRTELLGVDLPVANIASAARTLRASSVAVSLSLQSSGEPTRRLLMDLRERLPNACRLVIGGQGAARTRKVEGIERMPGPGLQVE